jgi:exopolyphosphatase/guanosine-5'-triphosphate,3'-diphosphate pyrophosphatase
VHNFENDILVASKNIAKRYSTGKDHIKGTTDIALTIFDSMKKVHGMGQRERLYLRLAAILHDCGKYISLLNVGEASYDIIMATEMIGLSHMEREIVANVVRFNHSDFVYYGQAQERPMGLDKASYLTVAKLTAILRLANSLDRSHKQKMKGVKAVLQENELILKVDTQEDITLEKGFFQTSTEFFKEVYSITPVIRQKKKF